MQTRKQMPRAGQCAFPQGTVLPRLLDAHIMIMHVSPCLETISIEASLVRSYWQLYICAAITTVHVRCCQIKRYPSNMCSINSLVR